MLSKNPKLLCNSFFANTNTTSLSITLKPVTIHVSSSLNDKPHAISLNLIYNS